MLAFYTPQFNFAVPQLVTMLQLQCQANDVMSDAWRTSCNCDIQYYRAAHKEASEAMDHIGWKWWKKFSPDVEQMKLELIDILHFGLSHLARDIFTEASAENETYDEQEVLEVGATEFITFDRTVTIEHIGKYFSPDAYEKIQYRDGEVDIKAFPLVDLLELFMSETLINAEPNWNTLFAMFDSVGMSPDEVYNIYVAKNVLNIFRTANGQRANTYRKIWAGREDNEYVTEYRQSVEASGSVLNAADLTAHLQATYNAHLEANTAELG